MFRSYFYFSTYVTRSPPRTSGQGQHACEGLSWWRRCLSPLSTSIVHRNGPATIEQHSVVGSVRRGCISSAKADQLSPPPWNSHGPAAATTNRVWTTKPWSLSVCVRATALSDALAGCTISRRTNSGADVDNLTPHHAHELDCTFSHTCSLYHLSLIKREKMSSKIQLYNQWRS